MKSIVVEKELRLREGMQMMGMSSNMYWLSWFATHWLTGMCTVVLLVLIGIYPFEYTNPLMQLIFYTSWITSCILWNYMLSTFFSRSITASVVGCFVYVVSIAPAIAGTAGLWLSQIKTPAVCQLAARNYAHSPTWERLTRLPFHRSAHHGAQRKRRVARRLFASRKLNQPVG